MTSREGQETTVTHVRADDTVHIWTANPVHLRKLRKEPRATELQGDEEWGKFTVPATDFDPLTGFKSRRKPLTDEEKAKRAEAFRRNVLGK